MIDGQALTPSSFGYTDGLTGTWRPKKYEGTYGTNGFWLPFDGSSPIGNDQSGNGNNWSPRNIASGDLNIATGALPTLNTVAGGNVAAPRARGNAGVAVTVYNSGSGNKYYLDGVETASLDFVRGQTVTFNTGDSTVSGHPFRFSATENGTHGGGSEYTDGRVTGAISAGTVGAATTITFPHNAPNTLYYYCTAHSGMGGSATIGLSTDIRKADLYGWKNTLALSGSVIADDSNKVNCTTTTKTLSTNGSTTLTSTRSNFYARSIYFDGNGDYIAVASSADCSAMGTGDFCFEAWVYMINLSNRGTWFDTRASNNTTGLTFGHETDGAVRVYLNASSGGDITVQQSTPCKIKTWYHMAVTRESGTVRLFINGQNVSSGTNAGDMDNTNAVNIGYRTYTSSSYDYFTGYMNEARIYKGAAKYTSNFIPASTQPDIIKDSPSGTVYDSALEKSVSGAASTKKEGNQNISVAASSDFAFGTGDFTVEGYFYITDSGSNSNAWDLRDAGDINQFFLRCISGTSWDLRFAGGQLATFTAEVKVWNHIAVSRSGSTLKIFVNGVQTNSISNSSDATNTGPLLISTFYDTTGSSTDYGFSGLVSNFRVVKGTALYTQDFVPSTKPLTNVTNTKLLFCNDENFVTSATVTPGTITVTGTQTLPSSFSPFNTSIDEALGKGSDYCTFNFNDNGDTTITDAGTYVTANASGGTSGSNVGGTIGMPLNSGKYYWEYTLMPGGSASGVFGIGYGSVAKITALANLATKGVKIYGYSPNGSKYENDSATSYGPTITVGTTISVLFDSYKRELVFWHNGVSQGLAYTVGVPDKSMEYVPMVHANDSSGSAPAEVRGNWGQQPFKYKPPEGYKTLSSKNLPNGITTPATSAAACVLWTGNQTLTQINIGFQPDLIWGYYPTGANSCYWVDSVRGSNKLIYSNQDANESTNTNVIDSSNFNDTGFRIGTSTELNGNGNTYMGWCFKAGGQKNTFNIDDIGSVSYTHLTLPTIYSV